MCEGFADTPCQQTGIADLRRASGCGDLDGQLLHSALARCVVTGNRPCEGACASEGALKRASDRVNGQAEILALDPLEAWLDVPERYIERLSRSAGSIRVRIDALEEEREAVSVSIIPLAEMRSRLFPVRVELANPDERMRPGMTVAGLVPTGSVEPSLLVHKDAIRRDDAGAFVYFDGAGVAAVARVQTLFAVGDHIAIRQGALPPDANVVVEGNERLFPGQPLETTLRESTLQTAESGSE